MRKILLLILIAVLCSKAHGQQNVVRTKEGNYTAVTVAKKEDAKTGSKFVDSKGISYDVYQSSKGKLYYKKVSKTTQKEYKVYLAVKQ